MKSICITKDKAYYIVVDGREEAKKFIEFFKPFYKNKTVMIQEAIVLTSYTMDNYIIKEGEE